MKTRIKDLREDNDLTQKDLSKMLNISQVAYSYYEINKRSIPLEVLSQLADFYKTYPKKHRKYVASSKTPILK